jgi:hypothetical protein
MRQSILEAWFCCAAAGAMLVGCAHDGEQRAESATAAAPAAGEEDILIEPAHPIAVLERKLARYAPVRIGYDARRLDPDQRRAVEALVAASRIIDDLFWRQASPHGPVLRDRLAEPRDATERLLADYLHINYGAYDRLDDFAPFMRATAPDGRDLVPPKPLGANFYPVDLTKQQWRDHLEAHPQDRPAFESNFTVIRRRAGGLEAIPYSEHYAAPLAEAAELLERAAEFVGNDSLARYLRTRAAAFRSNDYYESDMAWMDVSDSLLEVTIGPYEVYEDRLFNYKAAFESFITIRDAAESEKLARVAEHLVDMERNLPIPDEHKNFDRGLSSPILVVDLIYSAGDTRAGVQTLAFNLPNDERVREAKGSKKVMLKNISHAKFDRILQPIAERVLLAEQRPLLSFDAYFNHTLMHEVSHGLGPGFIERDGERTTVNRLLKEHYSAIEEAKADVLGMFNTLYLVEQGVLDAKLAKSGMVTFLAGVFRSVRFGVHESHGRANAIVFNYLLERGAYRYHPAEKRFSVDLAKAPQVVRELAHRVLMIEAEGDYTAAGELIESHGHLGPEMKSRLEALADIPVDIVPSFAVDEQS